MVQTIANHEQCVRILEKFYGFDNPQTAHAYSSLSLFYYTAKEPEKAFAAQLKSLYIFNLIGGEFVIFTNSPFFLTFLIASRMRNDLHKLGFDVSRY